MKTKNKTYTDAIYKTKIWKLDESCVFIQINFYKKNDNLLSANKDISYVEKHDLKDFCLFNSSVK